MQVEKAEEEQRRLAHEMQALAEIARIMSSSLDIAEVYERFAEQVRLLIPIDRIAVSTVGSDDRTGIARYVWGMAVSGLAQGLAAPLEGPYMHRRHHVGGAAG